MVCRWMFGPIVCSPQASIATTFDGAGCFNMPEKRSALLPSPFPEGDSATEAWSATQAASAAVLKIPLFILGELMNSKRKRPAHSLGLFLGV